MEDKLQTKIEEIVKDKNKKGKEIYRFSFSSLISFIIDYSLYSIILLISNNIILSNVIARIFSSIVNFTINKKMVFQSKKNLKQEILKYYILAFSILILNSIVLNYLSLYINPFMAKLITELLLFILSYFIQKKFVFKGSDIYKKQ